MGARGRLSRRGAVLAVAALLFAVVFVARLAVDSLTAGIVLFFMFPIALVALEFGAPGGLLAAAVALGLTLLWAGLEARTETMGVVGFVSRGTAFALLGFLLGKYAHGALERYDPDLLRLNRDLRKAIGSQQLSLHYQPIAELRSHRVVAAEALARWRHPERGDIPPDSFVPAAERSEVVWPFTLCTLEIAARQIAGWRTEGLELPAAVNLSTVAMMDQRLPGEIRRIVEANDIPPGLLHLEITESAVMSNPERAVTVLGELGEIGTGLIAIDDFGTGYSSLARLDALPLDALKIDRSLIWRMASTGDERVVRAVIRLARSLELSVVAEGIEDDATWSRLTELGCDLGQGYILARPCPPEQLMGWVEEQARGDGAGG